MGLRNVDVAKIVIQKDLDCRFVTTKDLSHPTDEDPFVGAPVSGDPGSLKSSEKWSVGR
jgi:hypothetical protein